MVELCESKASLDYMVRPLLIWRHTLSVARKMNTSLIPDHDMMGKVEGEPADGCE